MQNSEANSEANSVTNEVPMQNKSEEVKAAIERLFPGTAEAIKAKLCPCCKGEIKGFIDAISKREYLISGLCQDCQDDAFGT